MGPHVSFYLYSIYDTCCRYRHTSLQTDMLKQWGNAANLYGRNKYILKRCMRFPFDYQTVESDTGITEVSFGAISLSNMGR